MASVVAEIPGYLQGTNPLSIEAVTRKLAVILGLSIDLTELRGASNEWESRVSEAVEKNPDLAKQVRKLEESYDDGDLVGHGHWEFETTAPEETRVSFHCRVRSNRLLMHIGFALGGERGHNAVYQAILAALKAHAVASPI